MKSVKFASLTLLCATSILALVLPALGVVSFPEQFISADVNHRTTLLGEIEHPLPDSPSTSLELSEGVPARNASFGGNPAGAHPGPTTPVYPPGAGGAFPHGPQPVVPSGAVGAQVPPGMPISHQDPLGWNQDPQTQKVGTGIWLLLGPVWLLALLIWSIAPDPNTTSSRSGRKK